MNKASLLNFIKTMARGVADDDTVATYVEDVLRELALSANPPMVGVEQILLTSGTKQYDYPVSAEGIIWAFFNGVQLGSVPETTLEAYNYLWENDTGLPVAWKALEEEVRKIRFYPIPNITSDVPSYPEPFGDGYPANGAAVIFGEKRDDDIHDWLVLYITFEVLSREFSRPSNHQDNLFAEACKILSGVFLLLGGSRGIS